MYKINIHGSILEFGQIVLNSSPFLRTLFEIDNTTDIIVFNELPLEDMKTYIEYCTTGIMRYLIIDVLKYMSHKLLDSHHNNIIAKYEDQWHIDNDVLPQPEETIYTLSSLVSHMLKGRMYVIDRKCVRIATHLGCVKYMGISPVDYNGLLMYDLMNILDGQVYAISITNSETEIDINIVGDGTGMSFNTEQNNHLETRNAIIRFNYGYRSLVDILYSLPNALGSILYDGKIYRTSKHKYHLDERKDDTYAHDLLGYSYMGMRQILMGLQDPLKRKHDDGDNTV